MKLWVSNADVLKQFVEHVKSLPGVYITDIRHEAGYVQCKLFLECGNVAVAEECKNVLKSYNNGRVGVEDIEILYKHLKRCTGMITEAKAYQFDLNRLQ